MFLKVDNVGAERICSGRLFQATGPTTQNARLVRLLFEQTNERLTNELTNLTQPMII